jgi:hypothetical protein
MNGYYPGAGPFLLDTICIIIFHNNFVFVGWI